MKMCQLGALDAGPQPGKGVALCELRIVKSVRGT